MIQRKASQLNITIYKFGQDVEQSDTKAFVRRVADMVSEEGFEARIDLMPTTVEEADSVENKS